MNILKVLDNLEGTVAAALSVVDEYPERSRALKHQVATGSRSAADAWLHFGHGSRKTEWENLRDYLEKQPSNTAHWQQRAKLAESKLLQLCSALLACPDPAPHLQGAASASARVAELEEQNRQLRVAAESAFKDDAEVQGLLARFEGLEAAHRQLQEDAAAQDAELGRLRASAVEVEAARQHQKEREAEIVSAKAALKALRVEYEHAQSQLFELTSQREQESTANHTDVDLLINQLERAHNDVRELQREKDSLNAQLNSVLQQPGSPSITAVAVTADTPTAGRSSLPARSNMPSGREAYWEVQMQLRDKKMQRLQSELDASKLAAQEAVQAVEAAADHLRRRLAEAEQQLVAVNEQLQQRPSKQDIRELQQRNAALQAVVDVQVEAEGWDSPALTQLLHGSAGPTAIQTIVQERNRKLSAELTAVKQLLEAKDAEARNAADEVRQLRSDVDAQKELAKKLEEDLQAAATGDALALPAEVGDRPGPGAAVPTEDSHGQQPPSTVTAVPMVDIVARQRDRFRQRVGELEDHVRRAKEDMAKSQARIESVTKDNVLLYEKLEAAERINTRYQCGPFSLEVPSSSRDDDRQLAGGVSQGLRSRARTQCFGGVVAPSGLLDVEQQYARAYEAQLNPFKAFKEGESEQRIKSLGFGDRAVLTGGKLLAGSKVARIFVTTYAALLHGFIMLLLYFSASPCTSRYATVVPAPPSHTLGMLPLPTSSMGVNSSSHS